MRRMPAKRSNGRTSTKCNDCFSGVFWKSEFGMWFADATTRQSPESMPLDDEDIKNIHSLWKDCKSACGLILEQGKFIKRYDYHMCHRDPAKGNGYQGRFTYGNLMIAEARINQSAGNKNPIDHGYRVYTSKKPFGTTEKVKQWCGGQYRLTKLVDDLKLKKHVKKVTTEVEDIDFLPEGVPPRLMIEKQLKRFEGGSTAPWRYTTGPPSEIQLGALVFGIGIDNSKVLKPSELPLSNQNKDDF
ncbi:hypothetical protein [uncultured Psychromonas sp.]|uniref:hypothetical protein n=1 Tax=uncultured Psychromonas sp. TaxID=173974 RepID=UPI00260E08B6|nr:hypothetical protein [uncultured Psychromonas sp.]